MRQSTAGAPSGYPSKAAAVSERVPSRTRSTFPATSRKAGYKEGTPSCRVRVAGWVSCAHSQDLDHASPVPDDPVVVNVIPAGAIAGLLDVTILTFDFPSEFIRRVTLRYVAAETTTRCVPV